MATGDNINTAIGTGGTAATAIGTAMHAAWVPFVGPIVAGVTLALGLWLNRKGPRQKVATTHIVDDLEPLLKQNLQGYMEGPRTKTSQAQALKNFDDAWSFLTGADGCGTEALGAPGRACIADRSPGGKWDWYSYYRDPIAADAAHDDVFGVPLDFSTVPEALKGNGMILAAGLVAAALIL